MEIRVKRPFDTPVPSADSGQALGRIEGLRTSLRRLGAFGWLGALAVGLVLLIIVSPYLGDAGPGSGVSRPTAVPRAGDQPGPEDGTGEPVASDSFLPDYDAVAHDQTIVTPGGPDVGDTVGFLAKFGLVLVLLYGSLRALRSFTLRQQGITSSSAEVVILERTHLSPNRALYLVSAGPKVLLLGGTDQQITFLAELTDIDLEDGGWEGEDGKGKMEDGR